MKGSLCESRKGPVPRFDGGIEYFVFALVLKNYFGQIQPTFGGESDRL